MKHKFVEVLKKYPKRISTISLATTDSRVSKLLLTSFFKGPQLVKGSRTSFHDSIADVQGNEWPYLISAVFFMSPIIALLTDPVTGLVDSWCRYQFNAWWKWKWWHWICCWWQCTNMQLSPPGGLICDLCNQRHHEVKVPLAMFLWLIYLTKNLKQ